MKRKYTDEERQSLGIVSNKRKGAGASNRTVKIRKEYLDFDDARDRRRASSAVEQRQDSGMSWIGVMIIGVVFLVILTKAMGA